MENILLHLQMITKMQKKTNKNTKAYFSSIEISSGSMAFNEQTL